MKTLIVIISFLLFNPFLISQEIKSPKKNYLYLELGGNSIIYSLNYERVLYSAGIFQTSTRIGFGYLPNDEFIFPLEQNFTFGKHNNYFQVGIGYTQLIADKPKSGSTRVPGSEKGFLTPLRISHLHIHKNNKFFMKIGILNYVASNTDFAGDFWLQIALGRLF